MPPKEYLQLCTVENYQYVTRSIGKCVVEIISTTEHEKILLIEQFRPILGKLVLEWPAGLVGDENIDETIAEAAKKELLEETGYSSDTVIILQNGPSSSGLTDEIIHFVYMPDAKNIQKVREQESIIVREVDKSEIHRFVRGYQGTISPRIYAGLYLCPNLK